MKIEELESCCSSSSSTSNVFQQSNDAVFELNQLITADDHSTKRALVGASARILFYPTLLYNVLRNKIQSESFRWWDPVDQFILLGAVPFPSDVPRLKRLGVGAVITLNEPYETLVLTSMYQDYGIDHLLIPTRDYLFAPSPHDIDTAVEFIHRNACCGQTTYVHCKAGRGRSTTIVLCYLVKYKHMTPSNAFEYVRSIRSRVLLAPAQRQAVKDYSKRQPTTTTCSSPTDAVLITKADLEGYHGTCEDNTRINCKELVIVRRRPKHTPMMAVEDDSQQQPTTTTCSSAGDAILITEADLEGYPGTCEDNSSNELAIIRRRPKHTPMMAVEDDSQQQPTTTTCSSAEDAILITKADLEGYPETCEDNSSINSNELAIFPRSLKPRPMMAMLSCFFTSMKVSGVSTPLTGRFPEAHAC
ncbi:hypothetical protein ACFE04_011895 [Oxalis oulophora]